MKEVGASSRKDVLNLEEEDDDEVMENEEPEGEDEDEAEFSSLEENLSSR